LFACASFRKEGNDARRSPGARLPPARFLTFPSAPQRQRTLVVRPVTRRLSAGTQMEPVGRRRIVIAELL
jgi:hypothetical protein